MIGKWLTLGTAVALVALGPMLGEQAAHAQAAKPRVAVIAFKNPTSWWGRELGASAASQLTTKLVQGSAFSVLERDRVKDIFDEWYLGQTGAVNQGQAAQMGKLHGVEYLVTGEFKSFNIRSQRIAIPFSGGFAGNRTRAESAINVRVINVTTGEVVAASEAKGDKVIGTGVNARGAAYGDITASSPWNPTVAEDALGEAIDKIAADITSQRTKFTSSGAPVTTAAGTSGAAAPAGSAAPAIAGLAADGGVYIDQGQNAGITVGKRYRVLRVVDVIKDAKGNELDKVTKPVGIIEVAQVLGRSSICKVIEGKPDPKDLLEPM
jgi:curli biogenesis system outer membrane secretion channel CsgG